jgi:hypothetical protein
MFTNSTGTTPVTANGDIVRYVRNKGKSSIYLYYNIDGAIYTTNFINGLSGIQVNYPTNNQLIYGNNTLTFDPTKGLTLFIVIRPITMHIYQPCDVLPNEFTFMAYYEGPLFTTSQEYIGLNSKKNIPTHNIVGRNELYIVVADPNSTTKIYNGSDSNQIYSDTYYIPPSGNYVVKPMIGSFDLGEILVYDQALSDNTSPTLDSIVSSLRTKWNITY